MKYVVTTLLMLMVPVCAGKSVELKSLPRTVVGMKTQTGGSEAQFTQRVGGVLQRYSGRTGYEACADICKTPNGWSAKIVSIASHMSCSTTRRCEHGRYQSLIHSHPTERSFTANAMDAWVTRNKVKPGDVLTAEDPRDFSEQDYTIPGYLVVYGQVWFQKGKGTERLIGPIEH